MNFLKFSLVFGLGFQLFSCSSQPVDFYPTRKNQKPYSRSQDKKTKDLPQKNYTTETVAIPTTTTYSQTPYGLSSTGAAISSSENAASSPPQNSENLLFVLKNPYTAKKIADDIIVNHLSTSQLEEALKEPTLINYRPLMLWQSAQLYQKNKRPSQSLEYYRSLATQYPQHSLASQANTMILLLQALQDVNAKVIGAILPLTGKNASVGQHALNALKIALGADKPNSEFKIAIYDTQSSPDLATAGVDKLILADKAIAIIGGLSSKEASLIAHRAEFLSVPFVALSQKPGLTNIGDFVFRNSLTPEMQVDQLVSFAIEKLNAQKFAILYPNDSYGVEFSNIFWDQVLARGAQVSAAQTYDPKENDFTGIIQKMVGTYYPEARPEEFKARLEEMRKNKLARAKKNKDKPIIKNSREHETEESVLQPFVDFDVLFLPDSSKTLGQVMAFMKVNDVNQMTFLGTNIWNTPDIVKRSSSQKENIFFVDALDPNDNSIRSTDFYKEYFASYNEEPTLIEMQTYESGKILRDQIRSGAINREMLATKLRIMGRSTGLTGELRMSNQREIERPVHVLSLENGIIKKVN